MQTLEVRSVPGGFVVACLERGQWSYMGIDGFWCRRPTNAMPFFSRRRVHEAIADMRSC